jgi:hypothetical protein
MGNAEIDTPISTFKRNPNIPKLQKGAASFEMRIEFIL